jgi:signal transduction histidine kinase
VFERLLRILIILSLLPSWLWASHTAEDSLLAVLKTQAEDTHKVLTYNELFKATFTAEPLKALDYAQKALKLARELDYKFGIARLCNNLGVWHSKRGNYGESLRYYAQTRTALAQMSDTLGKADCEMNIGSVHYKMGHFEEALKQYQYALLSYAQLHDTTRILSAVNNMGSVYKEQGHYPEALQAYMAALDLRERLGDPVELGLSCNNVGTIYQLQGMLPQANELFLRSLRLAEQGRDEFGKVAALTSLAEIAMEQHDSPQAERLLHAATATARKIDDQYGLAAALISLANLHQIQQHPDSALACYTEALAINRAIGRTQGVAIALNQIGALHIDMGKPIVAKAILLESLLLSDSLASLELSRNNHALLADIYASEGAFESAFQHQRQYMALNDTLYSAENSRRIAEMQERYKTRQQQEEIGRLNLQSTQDQLRIAQSASRSLVLLAILVTFVLIAAIVFLRYLLKMRHNRRIAEKNAEIHQQRDLLEAQNRQIREINVSLERIVEQRTQAMRNANQELDTFLYESAHALRRPLLRIQGLEDLIATEQDPSVLMRLRGQMRITLSGMDELLHKLIFVSESGYRDLKLEPIKLQDVIEEIGAQQPMAEVLVCEFPADFQFVSDSYLLKVLLTMVMENAFRFLDLGRKGQRVTVFAAEDEAFVTIGIQDTGSGIAAEHLPKVCEMFFRGPNHRGGNGLGLYIASKIVGKLHGNMELQSELGQGSTVTITLPRHTL